MRVTVSSTAPVGPRYPDSVGPDPVVMSDVPLGDCIVGLPDHVVIRQFYLSYLSEASSVVGDADSGRVIVVDPIRAVQGDR